MGRLTRFGKNAVCGILVFLIITLVSGVSHAVTFTVTNPGDAGAGTLREAIDMANSNTNGPGVVDVIEFNIPLPNTIDLITGELAITDDLTINGPGAEMLTVSGGNSSRIFHLVSGAVIKILKLRIADGNQTGAFLDGNASAILINSPNANVELSDCIVEDNTAVSLGAIYLNGLSTKLVVNRCSFTNNSAVATGSNDALGGVFGLGAPLLTIEVNDSTFTSNSSQSESGNVFGGVLYIGASLLDIKFSNCTFDSNYSTSSDGGLVFGGVLGDGASTNNIEFANCTFYNNYAECNGENCQAYGGAIGSGANSDISCNHCTFMSNSVSCTGDDCQTFGESIAPPGSSGSFTISNSIIQADDAANNCVGFGPAPISLGYNIDNGSTCVDGTVTGDKPDTDPMLDPTGLQDNDGPTETIALTAASPAIDMADPTSALTEDQRGAFRPFNGISDIGAFEFGSSILSFFHNPIFPALAGNPNTISAEEATPEGKVAFIWGFMPGSTIIGGQKCNGTELGIKKPRLLGIVSALSSGHATLEFFIPLIGDFEIAVLTQAVDINTCVVSEVIEDIIRKE